MATSTARVNLYINKDQWEKSLNAAKGKVTQLEGELSKLTEGTKEFAATKSDIDAYRKKVEYLEGKISGKFKPSMRDLRKTVSTLSRELLDMPTNAPERAMKIEQLQKAREELDKTKKEVSGVGKAWKNVQNTIKGIGLAGLFAGAVAGAKQMFTQMFQVRSEFEKFEAILQNSFNGSRSEAVQSMKMIQEIAAETPFSVQELTNSYVKLVNQGYKPTSEEIVKLGDLAATQGKQMDQLTEALIDAQVGEFERLKEFGIRANKEGDKVTFTFRGVKEQVDFTDESIRKYILSLGELSSVSGAMAGIAETQAGAVSNLGDKWDSFLNNLGKGSSGVIKSTIGLLGRLVDSANSFFNGSDTDSSLVAELSLVRDAMDSELQVMQKGNFTAEQRSQLIGEFNAKYAQYLPNLLSEEASLEQINKYQEELNKHMQSRVLFTAYQEQIAEIAKLELEHAQRMIDAEKSRVQLEEQRKNNRDDLLASGLSMQDEALLGMSEAALANSEKTFEEFEQQRSNAEQAVEMSAERLGTSLAEMQKLFGVVAENEAEKASEETIKALSKISEELEKHRQALQDASLSAEDREIAQAQRKYADLIAQAEEHGRDAADILDLQEQELSQIRQKWADARSEERIQKEKAEIERLKNLRSQMFTDLNQLEENEHADLLDLVAAGLVTEEEFQAKKLEIQQYYANERAKVEQDTFNQQLASYKRYVDRFSAMAGAVSGLVGSLKESELATVEDVQQGIHESDEAYAKRKEETERKKLEIAKKYAGLELLMKVSDIIAGTAAAIIQGYSQLGVFGTAFAAIMGATGAVQAGIAYKEYEKVKGYSEGGYTGGGLFKDNSGHSVAGVVHDNEYVVPKRLLEQPDIARVVHLIEQVRQGKSQGFAQGGPTSTSAEVAIAETPIQQNGFDSSMLESLLKKVIELLNKPSLALYDDTEARKLRKMIKEFDSVENSSKQ